MKYIKDCNTSVGIMSEDFCAFIVGGKESCRITDIGREVKTTKFEWYDIENGNSIARPVNAWLVERLLLAYANVWYDAQAGN